MLYILKIIKEIGQDDLGNSVTEWENIGIFSSYEEAKFELYCIEKINKICFDEGDYSIDEFQLNQTQFNDLNYKLYD